MFFTPPCYKRREQAFTLSELLIALAILGLIATFTIPKVLQNVESNQKKAVFKETFAALSEIVYEGCISGAMDATNAGPYILNKLNASKICMNNATTEGCFPQNNVFGSEANEPGALLANGASIGGLSTVVGSIVIDWNGAAGPNDYAPTGYFVRVDQVAFKVNYSQLPFIDGAQTFKPCSLGPNWAEDQDFLNSIFP